MNILKTGWWLGCHQFGIFPYEYWVAVIIPIDEVHHIFQRGGVQTTNQKMMLHLGFGCLVFLEENGFGRFIDDCLWLNHQPVDFSPPGTSPGSTHQELGESLTDEELQEMIEEVERKGWD